MTLPKLAVKRPVSVLMCVLCLLVFGVSSIFGMEMESTPEMSMPIFMVRTGYSGASPEEVDELITDVIESALSTVSDVESMTSRSSEGSSMTTLEFDYNTDMDEKYDEINEALQRVRLPDSADDPTIMEMSMDSSSVMDLSITTPATGDNIYSYIEDTVVPEIERISGVSEVSMRGGTREYIQVELREEEMEQYGLSMTDISSAISSADFTTTVGEINRGEVSLTLQGGMNYDTYESLETIPISLASGDIIHVSDVANVTMAEQSMSSISRYNGMDNISLSVSKNQSANTIDVCNQVVSVVDDLNRQGLGLAITITSNSGETIYENIMNVVQSLVLGLALAMLVLVAFLGDWRAAFIVAISMPLSVFAALVLMAAFGMTINIMSLGGLVVGIGMMVDNSIVVLDSCFKEQDGIKSYDQVAVEGANLVNSAIIASTVTTIVVFLPISLMNGMSGQLFKEVGFTIVFSLTASLISALTMVPLLFARMRPREKKDSWVNRRLHSLERAYKRLLTTALNHKLTVIIIAVVLGFDLKDAASIGIIGAADGPTSILVSQTLGSNYIGAIAVAAYSYMALVPIIQPFAIKLVTTKKERAMRMPYKPQGVTRRMRILFPIVVSVIAGLVAPSSVALVGFLMFGNLIRECGVLESLSKTAQNDLANLITLLLGITIAASMKADQFVQPATIMIMCLGLVAFVLDSMVGVIFVKILNIFTPHNKINPMVGAAGISAFPMSSRVIEKLGQEADPQNHLLMHAAAANVSGQIASVVAGGVVLQFFANMG